ncbi:MAG: MMPL family transporter [Pseudomonadales bacterium]|nr:MMPL family transporter [Pseudomonadales bacterium]
MNYIRQYMSGRYRECLNYPVQILAVVLVLLLVAAYFSRQFGFDASEDTLVQEGDPDLAYYQEVVRSFGSDEFLFLTYSPDSGDIFTRQTLDTIQTLANRIGQVPGVQGVTSLFDAPLLSSPPVPLAQLAEGYRTLSSADVDLALAREELTNSPLFRDLLISADGRSTALRIDLAPNTALSELKDTRDRLRQLETPSAAEQSELTAAEEAYRTEYGQHLAQRDATLAAIREIRNQFRSDAVIHLGGVPLVASDMIEYVKSDITVFGTAVVLLIAAMLFIIFRRVRWVVLPLLSTAVTVFMTIGVLGFFQQPVTIVSSNFVSLLAIISISFSIHLIAKYRELRAISPDAKHVDLVFNAMKDKLVPCVYTALTTMVAFGSLVTSAIVPVMDFGWIMCVGILVSLLVTYSLFAGMLLLLPKGPASVTLHHEPAVTRFFGEISISRNKLVIVAALVSFVLAIIGINRLTLNNRFIDYFKQDTEIHQGLAYIDQNLGGTIPLDVIIEFPPFEQQAVDQDSDFFTAVEDSYPQRYWFTSDKIDYVARLQAYLQSRPEIGKVLSIATLEQVGRTFNNDQALSSVELVAAIGAIPEQIRNQLILPYASPELGQMRISARIHETGPSYSLQGLIDDIQAFATDELGLADDRVEVTGMAVLFNGMLEHLLASQQSTLIFVITATFLMFAGLLRSVTLAVLGLIPNILAAATILAIMGFAGISLDIMTITIAAVIIGIGVDDAIHYLHRFKAEFEQTDDVKQAILNSHKSIGDAIYYTSFTVIIGFSVLGFSNFIPTVYFGILTAMAMALALLANLTILPSLLVLVYDRKKIAELAVP